MPKQVEYRPTSLKIPKPLLREAHIRAINDGTTFQEVVWAALEMYLNKKAGVKRGQRKA